MDNKLTGDDSVLIDKVIKGGYCIGCGACSLVEGSPMHMELDEFSRFKASAVKPVSKPMDEQLLRVCPFSNKSRNEDEIAGELFGPSTQYDPRIGYYLKNYAGFVSEKGYRERGSSGGMGSWILKTLLSEGIVDGVIHVKDRVSTREDKRLFSYQVSRTEEEINEGAKSKYYPIELSTVIREIKEKPGKYAVVGIPCFIKSIRLLAAQDEILKERIVFCIGLICGHLKSAGFAEMFAWQCGIKPGALAKIDFRTKLEGYGANQYGVTVTGMVDNKEVTKKSRPVDQLYGSNWGCGFFKYKACDYCDDVFAETADITIGDAWLPQYVHDSKGTNVITVRNAKFLEIIERGLVNGDLEIEEISSDLAAESQISGLNHRREGLQYRLALAGQEKRWSPKKRLSAENILPHKRARIQELRIQLAEQSHIAFKEAIAADDFKLFVKKMRPLMKEYHQLYMGTLWRRIGRRLKNILAHKLGLNR